MPFISGTLFFQCDKAIGVSFFDELDAHSGLVGQHFSWHVPGLYGAPSTIEFFEDTPQAVIDGVLAVYEAHDPTGTVTA